MRGSQRLIILLLIALILSVSAETIEKKIKKTVVKQVAQDEGDETFEVGGDSIEYNGEKGSQKQELKQVKNRKKSKQKKTIHAEFEPRDRIGPGGSHPVPVAIFHGFKQSCSEAKLQENVQNIHEGTDAYTECIEIGDGAVASMFTSLVKQSKEACQKINDHQVFGQQQFNVVGISQGALIARFIVESCTTKYPVRNLVTIGGPNNGMELGNDCTGQDDTFRCQINTRIRSFPMLNTYSKIIQSTLGPTNYVRNFQKHQDYLQHSIFLPYLNNERENSRYDQNKLRFESLNSFTMIMFNKDEVIFPKESEWFGQLDPQQKLVPMEATEIYTKNTFGLKTLDEQGRIFKVSKEASHLEYGPEYIRSVIVPALLK